MRGTCVKCDICGGIVKDETEHGLRMRPRLILVASTLDREPREIDICDDCLVSFDGLKTLAEVVVEGLRFVWRRRQER